MKWTATFAAAALSAALCAAPTANEDFVVAEAAAAYSNAVYTAGTNTAAVADALSASLTSRLSLASRDATNYTDKVAAALSAADAVVARDATNYTDSASAALSAADAVISRDATNYTDAAVADKIPYTVDSRNYLTALTIGTRASGSTNGVYSAAIGQTVVASAMAAFASGFNTRATANASAAFGLNTEASAVRAFAHGGNTVASGGNSHAEGYDTVASGNYSHAEGYGCEAAGGVSHAEGYRTVASGSQSHAEGYKTKATRNVSHTDGTHAIADHGQAYVWSGATLPETADNPAPESDYYHSHGIGTFNINPVAGSYDKSYGMYIGDSRLPTIIVSLLDNGRNYDAFSPTNDYSAGDFVVYNGYLYMFVSNHVAGAWDKSHIQWYQPPTWKKAFKAEIAAEIPTDNAQLANGAGYVTAAITNGLQLTETDPTVPGATNALNASLSSRLSLASLSATNYTDAAIGAAIANTNPVFSNAVLSVGLGIDTNAVAVLNEIAADFGGFPLSPGSTATTVGGLLAALAAAIAWLKKNKADASALRYAMPAAVALVAENDAATLVCADRAVTNATIASGFATLNLTFPAAVSGYVRDFYLRITVAAGESAPAISLPQGVTIENAGGAVPEIADGEASAAATTLVWFSETAPGVFTAKSETVKAVV